MSMEAGPELDALVAAIMGNEGRLSWNVMNADETATAYHGDSKQECEQFLASALSRIPDSWLKDYHVGSWRFYPHYSTDISAAWTVVAKMRELEGDAGCSFELRWNKRGPHTPSWVDDQIHAFFCLGRTCTTAAGHADTAPLAICLAAIDAVEQQNREANHVGDHVYGSAK